MSLSAFHTTLHHLPVRKTAAELETSKDIGKVLWTMATDFSVC